jgi:pyruvate dehydrogenase E2 component (dihydrolipoamide acetyltransferase)
MPKRADGRIIATPYAKKLAKELGVDLATVAGSGPNGRITASDVEGLKNGGAASPLNPPFKVTNITWAARASCQVIQASQ